MIFILLGKTMVNIAINKAALKVPMVMLTKQSTKINKLKKEPAGAG